MKHFPGERKKSEAIEKLLSGIQARCQN